MPRRFAIRRIALVATLSLLLGVLTTYGNGWYFAACRTPTWKSQFDVHWEELSVGPYLVVSRWTTHGTEVWKFSELVSLQGRWPEPEKSVLSLLPEWARKVMEIDASELGKFQLRQRSLTVIATGWPCRAICTTEISSGGTVLTRSGGTPYPQWLASRLTFPPALLPVRPVWPGFAINTVVFSALWLAPVWLLSLAPRFMTRTVRRRRNLCPYCTYSRAGLNPEAPCPECGSTATKTGMRTEA